MIKINPQQTPKVIRTTGDTPKVTSMNRTNDQQSALSETSGKTQGGIFENVAPLANRIEDADLTPEVFELTEGYPAPFDTVSLDPISEEVNSAYLDASTDSLAPDVFGPEAFESALENSLAEEPKGFFVDYDI